MIRAWLIRLLGGAAPSKRSVVSLLCALEDRLEALDSRQEKHRADFKELRGYVYAMKRGKMTAQEPAGGPIGDEEVPQGPPQYARREVLPTAHLANRFRHGG
jgi:hypothetical protein